MLCVVRWTQFREPCVTSYGAPSGCCANCGSLSLSVSAFSGELKRSDCRSSARFATKYAALVLGCKLLLCLARTSRMGLFAALFCDWHGCRLWAVGAHHRFSPPMLHPFKNELMSHLVVMRSALLTFPKITAHFFEGVSICLGLVCSPIPGLLPLRLRCTCAKIQS